MKLIGLVGGTTWLSTMDYYRYANEKVAQALGGLHSARVLLHSVDFAEVIARGQAGDIEGEGEILVAAARSVERGGAQLLALCANTAHVYAPRIQAEVSIPLVHIADAVAAHIASQGSHKVGVLCTDRTRKADIFGATFAQQAGCCVLLPDEAQQTQLDEVILKGAAQGRFDAQATDTAYAIAQSLRKQGADGILLGCTELPIMLQPHLSQGVYFDSTLIHVDAIVKRALQDSN